MKEPEFRRLISPQIAPPTAQLCVPFPMPISGSLTPDPVAHFAGSRKLFHRGSYQEKGPRTQGVRFTPA